MAGRDESEQPGDREDRGAPAPQGELQSEAQSEASREASREASSEAPIELPIEDALDLHSFAPRDIPGVVESYLEAARERGLLEVRLIHGKGTGVQRERVRATLSRLDWVLTFADAPAGRGHWGATVVRLRPL